MDQDSSLNNTFDFNTQNGVMLLLAAIRSSSLSTIEKNELRDLVFLYTNGGGDASVKIALEQKLRLNNIKSVAPIKKPDPVEPVKPDLPFGTYRPAPVFKIPTISDKPSVSSETNNFVPPSSVEQKQNTVSPVAAAVNPSAEIKSPITPVTIKVTSSQLDPIQQDSSTLPQQSVSSPTLASSIPTTPTPTISLPKVGMGAQIAPSTNINYLDRIREIKTAVNSKVGNPVNLVDINNAVGREYMNALLEAMKRLSGGAAGQIDVAMQRLEAAYQAVEVAVTEHDKLQKLEAEVEAEVSAIEPVSAFNPAPIVEKSVSVESQVKPVARPVSNPVSVTSSVPPVTTNTISVAPIANPVKPVVNNSRVVNPAPSLGTNFSQTAPIPTPAVQVQNPAPRPLENAVVPNPVPMSGFTSAAEVSATEVNNVVNSVPQATSLAQAPKILTPEDLPAASSITSSVAGDPLHTRDVDDGLEQLLSDWTIFNKSGLFGTGPKGREHPLFKRIADLQIPLLLSGRFEGSTQEIKQSITDYMNGWRYEQGIIYEQGETFEHYLRRVIKHILDLQNKRR